MEAKLPKSQRVRDASVEGYLMYRSGFTYERVAQVMQVSYTTAIRYVTNGERLYALRTIEAAQGRELSY